MSIGYLKSRRTQFIESQEWDIFFSAYNGTDRVVNTFRKVVAERKLWVIIPEYEYEAGETDGLADSIFIEAGASEADVVHSVFHCLQLEENDARSICVDITGFMRPHILYMARCFKDLGISRYDVIYTEPAQYRLREDTTFSGAEIDSVRQVIGFEGSHNDENVRDYLVVGIGYDDALVSRVATDKDGAKLVQMLSLPSLSADMYQESILRLDKASTVCDLEEKDLIFFAPANDPFVVASELSHKVAKLQGRGSATNLYFCPLATKVQALGFAIFYLREMQGAAASIIFPFTKTYSRETSVGAGRSWLYEIEGD